MQKTAHTQSGRERKEKMERRTTRAQTGMQWERLPASPSSTTSAPTAFLLDERRESQQQALARVSSGAGTGNEGLEIQVMPVRPAGRQCVCRSDSRSPSDVTAETGRHNQSIKHAVRFQSWHQITNPNLTLSHQDSLSPIIMMPSFFFSYPFLMNVLPCFSSCYCIPDDALDSRKQSASLSLLSIIRDGSHFPPFLCAASFHHFCEQASGNGDRKALSFSPFMILQTDSATPVTMSSAVRRRRRKECLFSREKDRRRLWSNERKRRQCISRRDTGRPDGVKGGAEKMHMQSVIQNKSVRSRCEQVQKKERRWCRQPASGWQS